MLPAHHLPCCQRSSAVEIHNFIWLNFISPARPFDALGGGLMGRTKEAVKLGRGATDGAWNQIGWPKEELVQIDARSNCLKVAGTVLLR